MTLDRVILDATATAMAGSESVVREDEAHALMLAVRAPDERGGQRAQMRRRSGDLVRNAG